MTLRKLMLALVAAGSLLAGLTGVVASARPAAAADFLCKFYDSAGNLEGEEVCAGGPGANGGGTITWRPAGGVYRDYYCFYIYTTGSLACYRVDNQDDGSDPLWPQDPLWPNSKSGVVAERKTPPAGSNEWTVTFHFCRDAASNHQWDCRPMRPVINGYTNGYGNDLNVNAYAPCWAIGCRVEATHAGYIWSDGFNYSEQVFPGNGSVTATFYVSGGQSYQTFSKVKYTGPHKAFMNSFQANGLSSGSVQYSPEQQVFVG